MPVDYERIGVTRSCVTCLECPWPELAEYAGNRGANARRGRRVARTHTEETGHATWVEETVEYSCVPGEHNAEEAP